MSYANRDTTLRWVIYNDDYQPSANYRRRVRRRTPLRPKGKPWRLIRARDGQTMSYHTTQQAAIQKAERLDRDGAA